MEETLDVVCLAESVHGIFSAAFTRFGAAKTRVDKPLGTSDGEHPQEGIVIADAVGDTDWKAMTRTWLKIAMAWLQSGFLPRLVVLRLVHAGRRASLALMLSTASLKWERAQQHRVLKDGSRDYKVCLRHSGYYTQPAMQLYGGLVSGVNNWAAMPECALVSSTRCLAFRCLARAAAVTYRLLVMTGKKQPFQQLALHGLHGDEADIAAAAVLREPTLHTRRCQQVPDPGGLVGQRSAGGARDHRVTC